MDHLIDIEIEDARWLEALPDAAAIVETGVTAALNAGQAACRASARRDRPPKTSCATTGRAHRQGL